MLAILWFRHVMGPRVLLLVGTVQRELQEILMAPLPSPPSSSPNGRRSAPGGAAAAAARRPRVVLRVGVQVVDFRPEG